MKRKPDEESAMAAERSPTSDTVKGCLPSVPEMERGTREGERMLGGLALCCFWTFTMSSPGCLVSS